MPALRRTLAGELAALNGRLVDLLLKNAPEAELKAVQNEVRRLPMSWRRMPLWISLN